MPEKALTVSSFPGFTEPGRCQYIIRQCSRDICAVRLDYEVASLAPPDINSEGACNTDLISFSQVGGANPSSFCGENAGKPKIFGIQNANVAC